MTATFTDIADDEVAGTFHANGTSVKVIIDNKEYLLEDDIEALAYIQMTWVKGWASNHVLYNI